MVKCDAGYLLLRVLSLIAASLARLVIGLCVEAGGAGTEASNGPSWPRYVPSVLLHQLLLVSSALSSKGLQRLLEQVSLLAVQGGGFHDGPCPCLLTVAAALAVLGAGLCSALGGPHPPVWLCAEATCGSDPAVCLWACAQASDHPPSCDGSDCYTPGDQCANLPISCDGLLSPAVVSWCHHVFAPSPPAPVVTNCQHMGLPALHPPLPLWDVVRTLSSELLLLTRACLLLLFRNNVQVYSPRRPLHWSRAGPIGTSIVPGAVLTWALAQRYW